MKAGIICDLNYSRHHLFKSYYYAVANLYGGVRLVHSPRDVKDLDILFIGDDHYSVHKEVWMNNGFITECNQHHVKVVALTNEKILNSFFPWNEDNLKALKRFTHLYHYANDVDDCKTLGLRLNRTAPSKHFGPFLTSCERSSKNDKMIFVGQTKCIKNSYQERKDIIKAVQDAGIQVDIFESNISTWEEYIQLIAGYKYVFSPIGNGNFFPMRFYETLAVGCIPVHQVRENTLELYDRESTFGDCIFFTSIPQIVERMMLCDWGMSYNKFWMEDNLRIQLAKDHLYGIE